MPFLEMSNKIIAEKNGYREHFTQTQWEMMGTDKMGWVVVPEEVAAPKVVAEPPAFASTPQSEIPEPRKRKPRK